MPSYRPSFISHAHADNDRCDPYAAALSRLGAPHYYDREVPDHGALLPYLLQDEIRKARVLVVMVTPAAQASQWVRLEIAMFHHLMSSEPDRKLVWVRLVDCVVEPLLAAHLGIDAVGRPLDQVIADVARALEDRSAPAAAHAPAQPAGSYSRIVDWRHNMGDHTTITAAIAAAKPGERILVRKGLYEGGLVIDKPLEIVGDGLPGDVEVRASGADAILFKATQGRVANLTLRQTGGGIWDGADIAAGRLELEDCNISSLGRCGVAIHDGADPRVRRCRIHDNHQSGIGVYDQGQGVIEDCEISGNALSGMQVKSGGAPTVRNCRIHDNQKGGVFVHDQGQGVIEDCEISGNGLHGVTVTTSGAPTVRKCRILRNVQYGAVIQEQGAGLFEENEFADNQRGVWNITKESKDKVTLRGNIER